MLTLRFLASLLSTLNIFQILHDVLYIGKKERKASCKFNRLQIEVLFLSNIRSPLPSAPKYRPIKFVLCQYICPWWINGILRYYKERNFLLKKLFVPISDNNLAILNKTVNRNSLNSTVTLFGNSRTRPSVAAYIHSIQKKKQFRPEFNFA